MKLYRNIKENSMVKESLVASHWGREIRREEFMIFLINYLSHVCGVATIVHSQVLYLANIGE
jgi:MFS-type transporter involved in bile tolerance (Atg22 family)